MIDPYARLDPFTSNVDAQFSDQASSKQFLIDQAKKGCGYIIGCVLVWVWLLITAWRADSAFVVYSHTVQKFLEYHSLVGSSRLLASARFQM